MRILVIDDDKLVAVSLKTILESDESIEVADIGYSGREAVDLYESVQPDVLLMDIRMDGMSGLDAATEILQKHPDAKILLLTTFSDDEYIIKALAIGTKGYIIKPVNMGQSVFGGEVASRLNGMVNAKKASGIEEKLQNISESVLTDKELEVAEQVAKGLNNKEIGEVLCLSEGTVRNYISFCLEKTGLRDRTQLAIWNLSGK